MKIVRNYFSIFTLIAIITTNILGVEKYPHVKRLPQDSIISRECARAAKSWNLFNERRNACNEIEKFLRIIDNMAVDEIITLHNKLEQEFMETMAHFNLFNLVSQILGLGVLREHRLNSKMNEIENLKQLIGQLKNERIETLKQRGLDENNEAFKQILVQLQNEKVQKLKKAKAEIEKELAILEEQ